MATLRQCDRNLSYRQIDFQLWHLIYCGEVELEENFGGTEEMYESFHFIGSVPSFFKHRASGNSLCINIPSDQLYPSWSSSAKKIVRLGAQNVWDLPPSCDPELNLIQRFFNVWGSSLSSGIMLSKATLLLSDFHASICFNHFMWALQVSMTLLSPIGCCFRPPIFYSWGYLRDRENGNLLVQCTLKYFRYSSSFEKIFLLQSRTPDLSLQNS